jgi:hypothetical protein
MGLHKRNNTYSSGRYISDKRGYIRVFYPEHPKANISGYVYEHILVAEVALGKLLPDGAAVHHFNENRGDNNNINLIVCDSKSYHNLLHMRQRAYYECGNVHWRRCPFCKQYDDPLNLYSKGKNCWHRKCNNEYKNEYYQKRKLKKETA